MRNRWVKYYNQSRGKRDFKGSSDKDYRTHGLNQKSQIVVFNQVEFKDLTVLPKITPKDPKVEFFHL